MRQKENENELWLAFSPIKSNYFNFMIQKATELGITKFLPVIFDRSIVRKINKTRLDKIRFVSENVSQSLNKIRRSEMKYFATFPIHSPCPG